MIAPPRPWPIHYHPAFSVEPTEDWAAVFSTFNPAGFRRPVDNLGSFLDWMWGNRIPVFAAELCYHDQHPALPVDHPHVWHFRLGDEGVCFAKEALLNAAVSRLPSQITKVFLLDADVVYENPRCFELGAMALDHFALVQPFSLATWLGRDGTPMRTKESTASGLLHPDGPRPRALEPDKFHPGFAVGMRRDFFGRVGGLYGSEIAGTGDISLWQSAMAYDPHPLPGQNLYVAPAPAAYRAAVREYVVSHPHPVACVPGRALHFWHGSTKGRAYDTRHKLLASFDPARHLTDTPDGLPVWTDAGRPFQEAMVNYFRSREEDGTP